MIIFIVGDEVLVHSSVPVFDEQVIGKTGVVQFIDEFISIGNIGVKFPDNPNVYRFNEDELIEKAIPVPRKSIRAKAWEHLEYGVYHKFMNMRGPHFPKYKMVKKFGRVKLIPLIGGRR